MKIPIKVNTNLLGISKTIESAIYGVGARTLEGAMRKGMEKVREQVLQRFDATQRNDSTGRLRRSISPIYSIIRGAGEIDSIVLGIGNPEKMPPHWRFQEFGTKQFTFVQPFLVHFTQSGIKLSSIKKAAVGELVGTPGTFQLVPGIGIVKPIQVVNPGIKARGFFLAGKTYLNSNGVEIFGDELFKFFSNTFREHARKTR